MRSHVEIIKSVGATEMARRLGIEPNTVHAWVRANSIPAGYWRALADAEMASLSELAEAAEARRLAVARGESQGAAL